MKAQVLILVLVTLTAKTTAKPSLLSPFQEAAREDRSPDQTRHAVSSSRNVLYDLTNRVSVLETKSAGLRAQVDVLKERRCESGTKELDPYNEPVVASDNMKRHNVNVRFSHPFSTQPWVSVSLSMIDAYTTANVRVISGASDVTTSGFNVHASQWHDSHLYGVSVSWIACNV